MKKRDTIILGVFVVEAVVLATAALVKSTNGSSSIADSPQKLSVSPDLVIGPHKDFLGSGAYTLVEFGDYQCPPCRAWLPATKELVTKRRMGIVKLQFRHMPLSLMHPFAMTEAVFAEEARLQGHFWQEHEALYDLQKTILGDVGSDDVSTPKATVSPSSSALASVLRDQKDAEKLGLQETPSFVLCCPDKTVIRLGNLNQVFGYIPEVPNTQIPIQR